MSDLGFDPRPYCERLAKSGDRFTFYCKDGFWILTDTGSVIDDDDGTGPYNAQFWSTEGVREAWRFFGPLCSERKVQPSALFETCAAYWTCSTPLESIIAAVVESFESEVKG